jgi:hypothetical protein
VPSRYQVDILQDPEDLPPEHRARFITCLERRFAKLEGSFQAGGTIDILDAFEGPFVWEMTPEQLEATPPVGVEFTIESLSEPIDGVVHAVVRLVY